MRWGGGLRLGTVEDLGGGTFDGWLRTIDNVVFKTVADNGETLLGGGDSVSARRGARHGKAEGRKAEERLAARWAGGLRLDTVDALRATCRPLGWRSSP